MSALIAIEPAHYEAASACFGSDIADGLTRLHGVLVRDLADTGAMSGADAPGVEWGATYDRQAGSVVHVRIGCGMLRVRGARPVVRWGS